MTSLMGYTTETYDRLVEVFGEPTYSTKSLDEKVHTEWVLTTPNGDPVRIYDWKEIDHYVARNGDKYRWHIGGVNTRAVEYVDKKLGKLK